MVKLEKLVLADIPQYPDYRASECGKIINPSGDIQNTYRNGDGLR